MKKTALVLGATGLTGHFLLQKLIADSSFEKIKVFTRKEVPSHPKVEQFLGDLLELETFTDHFVGDVVFCCIGTTKAKTPDKLTYRAIDFGIPVKAAQLAKANGVGTFVVISAMGANAGSSVFYNRLKGEMEAGVLAQNIPHTYILRPSLITGTRKEHRLGETVAAGLMTLINPLLPKKYRSISAETIAQAMLKVSDNKTNKVLFNSEEIKDLAK